MACREQELLRVLRLLVENPGEVDAARRLIAEIDEDEETVSHARDPHGDGFDGT